MDDVIRSIGDKITIYPEGYAVDKAYSDIFYVPEDSRFDLNAQTVSWDLNGETQSIKLLAERTFVYPCGYRVNMEQNPASNTWRLVGTVGEGTLCHKPCTVSGGGKSEISKSISDAMISGSIFVSDLEAGMNAVEEILNYDFAKRFKVSRGEDYKCRPILSKERSLGSVIKLLNPSPENNDEFNNWLNEIPNRIKGLVFLLKRHYKEEWGKYYAQYDPALSNKLLDQVGLDKRDKDGFRLRPDGKTLQLNIEYWQGITPATDPMLELIKEYWEAVGLKTILKPQERSLHNARQRSSEHGIMEWGLSMMEIWNFTTDGVIYSSPAVADGKVFIGSYDDKIYCLDVEDGAEIWNYLTGSNVASQPAIADGKVFVGSGDDYVYCFGSNPPETPDQPDGPTEGEVGIEYTYSSSTTDPEGHSIYYNFSWGDDTSSGWKGPYISGHEVEMSHTWEEVGTYEVKVKAKDNHGAESNWSEPLDVIITVPELEIEISKDEVLIKNTGESDAIDVVWSVDITGGFLGLIDKHLEGDVEILPTGDEIVVELPLLLGIGPLEIAAIANASNADEVDETANGFIFLIFIFGI